MIRTADKGAPLLISVWVDVRGYIGRMAVVENALYNLLSTGLLQDRDMGSKFPDDQLVCILYTNFWGLCHYTSMLCYSSVLCELGGVDHCD